MKFRSNVDPRGGVLGLFAFMAAAAGTFIAASANSAQGAGLVQIAMLSGVSGRVTTMDCYDPNPFTAHPSYPGVPSPFPPCRTTDDSPPDGVTGSHSGVAVPTDLGASAGTGITLQNDYVPNNVRGGYIYLEDASTGCYARPTGSTYAGRRTRAYIYYYDQSSTSVQTDYHQVLYGHIAQENLNVWKKWNNYWATNPLWAAWLVNYQLNNLNSGGMPVGSVSTRGSAAGSCGTAPHLHQEMSGTHEVSRNSNLYSEGCWYAGGSAQALCTTAGYRWIPGQPVTAAYSDVHFLKIYVH